MMKRRCTADRVTVTTGAGTGLVMVRDDVVDFDAVVVPATDTHPALTLGAALGRHAAAFVQDSTLPPAVAAAPAKSSAPALPSSVRTPFSDGKKDAE